MFEKDQPILEGRRQSPLGDREAQDLRQEDRVEEMQTEEGTLPPPRSILEGRRPILEGRIKNGIREVEEIPSSPSILESRRRPLLGRWRRAGIQDEEERMMTIRRPARRHRLAWFIATIVVLALVAIVGYAYIATAAYHGTLNLLPRMQDKLVADGQRIDRALFTQKQAWGQRAADIHARVDGTVRAARGEADRQAPAQAYDPQTIELQNRIDSLEAQLRASQEQTNELQTQLRQQQSAPRQ
jgi:hypothetical protein